MNLFQSGILQWLKPFFGGEANTSSQTSTLAMPTSTSYQRSGLSDLLKSGMGTSGQSYLPDLSLASTQSSPTANNSNTFAGLLNRARTGSW